MSLVGPTGTQLTASELLGRGWTRTLIRRFLPDADGKKAGSYWANAGVKNTYCAMRAWEAEQSEEFAQAFLRSWKSRTKDPESFLNELRNKPKPR